MYHLATNCTEKMNQQMHLYRC